MKFLCTRSRKYDIERHSCQIKVYTYHIVILLRPNMIILVMLFSHYLNLYLRSSIRYFDDHSSMLTEGVLHSDS